MATLSSLPIEVIIEILKYLLIPSLFAFGLTSKTNHAIESISLRSLRIGVVTCRDNGIFFLQEISNGQRVIHSMLATPSALQNRAKATVIPNQTHVVREVLSKKQHSPQKLELVLWALEESAAEAIAKIQNLRHLSIRLVQHTFAELDLSQWYRTTSPISSAWDALWACDGRKVLGRLESLNLNGAEIKRYQLQGILEDNPSITELRLRKCNDLSAELFRFLAQSEVGRRLRVLQYTRGVLGNEILEYVGKLPHLEVSLSVGHSPNYANHPLQSLSFAACYNIDGDLMKKMNEEDWHIDEVVYPKSRRNALKEALEYPY